MHKEVFLSLLSLDAYNRGPGAQLTEIPSALGVVTLGPIRHDPSSSFTGVSYTITTAFGGWAEGSKIISFRGTESWQDRAEWPGNFAGYPYSDQQARATEFFQEIDQGTTSPIVLTGHSLGGALAGIIAALYDQEAVLFANISFEATTDNTYDFSVNSNNVSRLALRARTYGDATPWAPNFVGIRSIAIAGEVAAPTRLFQEYTPVQTINFLSAGEIAQSGLGTPINLHGMALHVIVTYAEYEGFSNGIRPVAKEIYRALHSDDVADAAEADSVAGAANVTNSQRLIAAIAYSVLDEGDSRPFGDTAVHSLWEDASNLAIGVEASQTSEALDRSRSEVADLLVQYSGLLAVNAVRNADDADAKYGVLDILGSASVLTVNLARDTWTFGGIYHSPIALETLINNAVGVGPNSVATTQYALSWYAEITNQQPSNIYELVGALSYQLAGGSPGTLTFLPDDGLAMFVLNDFNQIISSPSNQRDFIVGSAVADQINGGNGHDILIGNLGDDILDGGAEGDLIIGGIGADTIRGGASSGSIATTNIPKYTDTLEGEIGNDTIYGGGDYNILKGGSGSDTLYSAGRESHLYGGGDNDNLNVGSNTHIEDHIGRDRVFYGNIQLYGGVQQWWMEGNKAYWSPFSTLLTAFPVIGSELLYTASFFIDVETMKFATYMRDAAGNLQMNLGWGHAGTALIKDYNLDLDSGLGSAGITVFQSGSGNGAGGSLARVNNFVNLALYAGFGHGQPGFDPLVLDLDGDGFELTTDGNSHTYFEFDTDGFAERTGWVRGDDALLAIDLDANGKVDDITELFGNQTTSGFAMLGAHDLNADGVIDASDAVFAQLRVWRDLDQDGVTDAGELQTLAQAGIASIGLASAAPAEPTAIGGNQIARTGSFTRTNGSTGNVADVAFQINETASRWLGDNTVSAAAAALPQLRGFGTVKDLRVAMTGDSALEGLVDDFAGLATTDLAVLKADAEAILYHWAGVDGVAADAIGSDGFDARKLAFLEAYSGYALMPRNGNGDPLLTNLDEMEALWADQVTRLTLRLVVQGPMADAFDGISYRADLDLLVADTATALGDLYGRLLDDLPSDPGLALAQWQAWAPLLGAMADGMVRFDNNVVRSDYIAAQLLASMDGIAQPLDFATLAGALGIANLRIGTTGNDSLARGAAVGTAVYLGNGGADTLQGGGGQDVYIFGRTIGHVTIDDEEGKPAGDRIRFAFLTPDDVTLARNGNDLLITVTATGETVRVLGQFAPVIPLASDILLSTDKGVEEIQFADGTIFEIPEIMTAVGTGTPGDDHMIGSMHSDVFLGGLGDDLLEGGDDADLYVIKAGEGHDVIHEVQTTVMLRAADMVIFGDGIAPSDLVFARAGDGGDDLLVTIGANGQTLLIEGQFGYTSLGYNSKFAANARIEAFGFRNYGDGWGIRDLQQRMIADSTTAGNDTTRGFGDDDTFGSSAGNDLLIGMDGVDTYFWGAGSDNDVIDEQARYIDVNVGLGGLSLTLGADTIVFGTGIALSDLVFSRLSAAPDLLITLTATGETLTVTDQFAGFQTGPLGAQWLDRIEWFQFADGLRVSWQAVLADVTTGGAGDDHLWGDLYQDVLSGGFGDDVLSGLGLGDTYVFNLGDGADILADDNHNILGAGFVTPDSTPDILRFGAGITEGGISFQHDGADIILLIGAGGEVTLQGQDDYFHTGVFGAWSYNRIEEIRFDSGAVWTWQDLNARVIAASTTAGDDEIQGFTMADRFEASAGNDILSGGDSGDTYAFGAGSGNDIIRESVSNVFYGDSDVVEFGAGILPGDVTVSRDGGDLTLSLAGGDTLTIEGEFDYQAFYTWTDVELFRFANGTEWTKVDVQVMLLAATAGDDHLIGFGSDDALDGLAGDDILEGGDGSDSYAFGTGSGHDVIREAVTSLNLGENDRLVFGVGILPGDVTFSRDANDLIVTLVSGDSVRIEGQFNFGSWFAWNDIEHFDFANGTSLTNIQVAAAMLGGTPGDDHLVGTFRSDVLDGGAGNDLLEGGDGADMYVFGLGYGQDEIREIVSEAILSEQDQLRFGAGVTPQDLSFARDANDLIITIIGTSDVLTVTDQFSYSSWYTWWDVDQLRFDDGTTMSAADVQQIILTPTAGADHMVGFMTGDTLDGGAGNDLLEGGDGADTYMFGLGYGQDEIRETIDAAILSENDTVSFTSGVSWSDLAFARDGEDLIITIAGTSDTLTITGQFTTINDFSFQTWWDVENFVFADGTQKTAADVMAAMLIHTDGNDHLVGFYADDRLAGGLGNDLLEGGRGTDTYVYNLGDGQDTISDFANNWGSYDILEFGAGIAPSAIEVSVIRGVVRLSVAGTPGSVSLIGQLGGDYQWGIDEVRFADGTIWSRADLAALTPDVGSHITGTSGNDALYGSGGGNIFDGGFGNDYFRSGWGSDTYIYASGEGSDWIDDEAPSLTDIDTLEFLDINPGDVTVSRNGVHSTIKINSTGHVITLDEQFYSSDHWGIDRIKFADGTIWDRTDIRAASWIRGTSGNDGLYGGGGGDTFVGGLGDDYFRSGSGSDTYIYASGDGSDWIDDEAPSLTDVDTLEFLDLNPSDVMVTRNGVHSQITINSTGHVITLDEQFYNSDHWGIDRIKFADGTIWDRTQIQEASFYRGTPGNDWMYASDANDTLEGKAGNDTLYGLRGNDTLIGGAGNDTLIGSEGNDIYRFGIGDGQDVVRDYGDWWSGSGGTDVVALGVGIVATNVTVGTADNGGSYVLYIGNGDDRITLTGAATWGSDYAIETILFADGSSWTGASLAGRVYGASLGDDTIGGSSNADALRGLSGDDTLKGGGGGDTLYGDAGNDVLFGDGYLPIGDNLVVNGSFETSGTVVGSGGWGIANSDLPGWDKANSQPFEQVYSGVVGINAAQGNFWLDLDSAGGSGSNMDISQTVEDLDAGAVMILRFDHANYTSLESGSFEVYWNGVLVATIAETGAQMRTNTFELVAAEGDNVLRFVGIGPSENSGAALDNVRLFATQSGNGSDTLYGGDGNDLLIGGVGADVLSGGTGADTFIFAASDSGIGNSADRIADFVSGTDVIDLSALDADSGTAGNQAFSFIGNGAFTGVAGELRYFADGSDTRLAGDIDGDMVADFEIVFAGTVTPIVSDFAL